MDAEHAASVLAGCARLAAKARRVGGVVERQRVRLQDLVHVEAGERNLGCSSQVEPVALDLVDVGSLGREEAGAVHRLLADEDGRAHQREPRLHKARHRQPEDRLLEQGRVADDVAEPRAREPRRPFHLEAA